MTTTTFETIFVTQTFIPPTSTISHVIKTSNPNETRRAIKKETVSFSRTFLSVVLLLNTNILLVINANITAAIHAMTVAIITSQCRIS